MEALAIKALTGGGGGVNVIDDTSTSTTKTWSSSKLNEDLEDKITNPSGGTAGQVLKKTASGVEWANESGGGGGVDYLTVSGGKVCIIFEEETE